MIINLTRLLEVPLRIKWSEESDIDGKTCSPIKIDYQTTSSDRAYLFELGEGGGDDSRTG